MNQKPQDLRRSAAEKFIESFDQELLRAFQESEAVTPNPQPAPPEQKVSVPPPPKVREAISLSDLEAAISDIEQYLHDQHIATSDESPE
ncbi:conserved hypothetical protein [Planktothrix sp. PCC 11201]|uniref:hypothetical protein n=1 Tax=Planktothrix sp. PCC 11201 TaxID=1729650 RepID=UPI00091B25D2|nr:hypothetical protein [Planktothrix sp. PCC 11201]SKB13322.1 conserved hypothetical protein [Planktothrix sp. PCC 11201]